MSMAPISDPSWADGNFNLQQRFRCGGDDVHHADFSAPKLAHVATPVRSRSLNGR
jgi:hypothetical protein